METKISILTDEDSNGLGSMSRVQIRQAYVTDLYIIQGGYVVDSIENTADYWTQKWNPNTSRYEVDYISSNGTCYDDFDADLLHGVRPVIDVEPTTTTMLCEKVEYGEYPQSVVSADLENELEELYKKSSISKTGKSYTFVRNGKKEKYQEYKYENGKFIRITAHPYASFIFENGRKAKENVSYWVKVEPIIWDKIYGKLICQNALSVMQFSRKNDVEYDKSDIKEFLENNFIKDIVPSREDKIDNNMDINETNIWDSMKTLHKKYRERELMKKLVKIKRK